MATARASGIEWFTATNSQSNGPSSSRCALLHLERVRLDPVLLQLGLDHRQRQPRADQRDVGLLAQQVGHRPDVVLVAVGENDGLDGVQPVPDVVEVGQDQVDAGLEVLGEQHPAVDDEQPARRTRRPSCCARPQPRPPRATTRSPPSASAGGGPSSGCGWLTGRPRGPRAAGRPRRRSAGSSGGRTVRSGMTPRICSAALARIAPCDDRSMIARTAGHQPAVRAPAPSARSPASTAATIAA